MKIKNACLFGGALMSAGIAADAQAGWSTASINAGSYVSTTLGQVYDADIAGIGDIGIFAVSGTLFSSQALSGTGYRGDVL